MKYYQYYHFFLDKIQGKLLSENVTGTDNSPSSQKKKKKSLIFFPEYLQD